MMKLEHAYEISDDSVTWKGPTAPGWRLPTAAEWEYACRAGRDTDRYGRLEDIAWYRENSAGHTHPVMEKKSNDWGLYDMLGNVDEWCWDWHDPTLPQGPARDPTGPDSGSEKVVRGGCWQDEPWFVRAPSQGRSFNPNERFPMVGFRMARTI
jgi:formylglycine-generating enzyme required for sulfatase activity